jgi:hypothetical protein
MAASDFLFRYPERDPPQQYIFTHLDRKPVTHIKCPTVIEYQGCVFTLDYEHNLSIQQLTSPSDPLVQAALWLVRACVGKWVAMGGVLHGVNLDTTKWERSGSSYRMVPWAEWYA